LISSGEGGIFVSFDEDWVTNIRRWSNFGFDTSRSAASVGINAKMSEYSAAVGLASLEAWDREQDKMMEVSAWAKFVSLRANLKVQPSLEKNPHAPYWIVWSDSKECIEDLIQRCRAKGVETRRWWEFGCHKMAIFKEIVTSSNLQTTKFLAANSIGLPFFADLTMNEREVIEEALFH
jgi:dTDP-4-amino-4,6-dideoxygalactose transaminase